MTGNWEGGRRTRAAEWPPGDRCPAGTLTERTRALLAEFDRVSHDTAFDDSGEDTAFATWMADLLEEFLSCPVAVRPEDSVDWVRRYEARCKLYPLRDCPGCVVRCSRVGDLLGYIP